MVALVQGAARAKPRPKRAPSAFVLFTASIRHELNGSASTRSQQAADRWHALSAAQQASFRDQHEQAKAERRVYNEATQIAPASDQ